MTTPTWIQTFLGHHVPITGGPVPLDVIDIRDIAHALSHQCRFTGHTRVFYSVAQHSVWVAQYLRDTLHAPVEVQFIGLMHDAGEAYLVDVPRPIKAVLKDYAPLALQIDEAIKAKFQILDLYPALVREADNMALAVEAHHFMHHELGDDLPTVPIGWRHRGENARMRSWSPPHARSQFALLFDALSAQRPIP